MGLEMADAACPVSLRAHRYNACSLRRVMLSPGKRCFGGGYPVLGWWHGALQWGGEEGVLLGSVPALRRLPEFAGEKHGAGSRELWCWRVLHMAPAPGSSWGVLHSFGLQGRQRAKLCAGQRHSTAVGFGVC